MGAIRDPAHVNEMLPPSFPSMDDSSIHYFVKATVNRIGMFKRNLRNTVPIVFCPIDLPREPSTQLMFVRKQAELTGGGGGGGGNSKSSGLWGAFTGRNSSSSTGPSQKSATNSITFEVRCPTPAVATLTQPIDLTLLIRRLTTSSTEIVIQALTVSLLVHTHITARGLRRDLTSTKIVYDTRTLQIIVPPTQEFTIPPQAYGPLLLPSTVAPSFRTCNIAQSYQLVVSLGLCLRGQPTTAVSVTFDIIIQSGFKVPSERIMNAAVDPAQLTNTNQTSGRVSDDGDGSSSQHHQQQQGELPSYTAVMNEPSSTDTTTDHRLGDRGHSPWIQHTTPILNNGMTRSSSKTGLIILQEWALHIYKV